MKDHFAKRPYDDTRNNAWHARYQAKRAEADRIEGSSERESALMHPARRDGVEGDLQGDDDDVLIVKTRP